MSLLKDVSIYTVEFLGAVAGIHTVLKRKFNYDMFKELRKVNFIKNILLFFGAKKFTIEDLKEHDIFAILEIEKTSHKSIFYTHDKRDHNKEYLFDIFIYEKFSSVQWAMMEMLKSYLACSNKMSSKGLKSHILMHFKKCDENLDSKLEAAFREAGVPAKVVTKFMAKFWDIRQKSLDNYQNRIQAIFSNQYGHTNELLILFIFELITFETPGMIRDIKEAFNEVNGDFVELNLKKNKIIEQKLYAGTKPHDNV
jgi:hypothetical protein